MKKIVKESLDDVLKPKNPGEIYDDIVSIIDKLIIEFQIFKYRTSVFATGKGTKILEKFKKELPKKINAGENFYECYNGRPAYKQIESILKSVYNIEPFNINKFFGGTVNVPHYISGVQIDGGDGSFKKNSLVCFLEEQKIVLDFFRSKSGTSIEPDTIYFDYDFLKQTIRNLK